MRLRYRLWSDTDTGMHIDAYFGFLLLDVMDITGPNFSFESFNE
jgi:hypothetical protein